MLVKDKIVHIKCDICRRNFPIFVNENSWAMFNNQNDYDKSTKELFPHLLNEEINVLETGICDECV